ncbi:winged helix-turn-helix transcriptional regulator [Acinetobacter seifertii]|uniref:winged helix-turn-helix transcriptional regulator n=1 Tax=Acinetobacter seifertii TaxID=1530123 RepID=UPI00168ACAE4|nr:winged helix-turn-helix transcriptional regulator [Acinetobacter seifertii]
MNKSEILNSSSDNNFSNKISLNLSQIPPEVEYLLSKRDQSLIPLLNIIYEWDERNINS